MESGHSLVPYCLLVKLFMDTSRIIYNNRDLVIPIFVEPFKETFPR